jgi:hypothetical protein
MLQRAMIERLRYLCRLDERLAAAMMHGSFAQFEGDEFSDIEFILFFFDEVLGDVDHEEWVARIAPVELYLVNEFGNGTAIFDEEALWSAYLSAWSWGRDLMPSLVEEQGVALPTTLLDRLDRRLAGAQRRRRG